MGHLTGSWNWDSDLPIFSSNENPNSENEETEPETIRTDTETEQESKWSKIRLREKALRLFSRNYQILNEEVDNKYLQNISFFFRYSEKKEKKGGERQVQHPEQSMKKIDPISFPGRRRGQQQQQTKKDSDSLRQRR